MWPNHALHHNVHPKLRIHRIVHDRHLERDDLVRHHAGHRVRQSPLEVKQRQLVDVVLGRKDPQRTALGFERPVAGIVQTVDLERAHHRVDHLAVRAQVALGLVAAAQALDAGS